MKRGRQSAADLSIVAPDATGTRPTLTPLRPLKSDEKAVFDLVVRENVHLQAIDVPLLMGFARASAGLFNVDSAGEFESGAYCHEFCNTIKDHAAEPRASNNAGPPLR